ncbi:hypothetical protein ISS40_01150 [Candidatus Bathyarchaeota archaeon]|nr:hypothetical protein [Candidatus Bathyarchaeota archaeon]MBL7167255.1 hypothetical protein [Candidatus Bathyarchaeota archaeon]
MEPRIYSSAVNGGYYTQPRSTVFEAQMITPGDIADIEAVTILDEVLGLARPQYKLRPVCRPIRMDSLTARIDVATALAGQEKVPALVEAEITAEAYTVVDFDLWKNVVHVVLSDEARKKAAHDILGLHVSDAARDLARMENKQIVEIAEACTEKVAGTAYSDWGAITSGLSDTNPMLAIQASLQYIEGKGYEPDFMALHPTLWGKFIQNTYVRDLVHAGIASIGAAGGQFTLPGFPTVKVFVDYALTETPTASLGPLVGSTSAPALVLGQGPTEAARYRDEKAGYDAYIIRQYLEPKLVLDDGIDKICT